MLPNSLEPCLMPVTLSNVLFVLFVLLFSCISFSFLECERFVAIEEVAPSSLAPQKLK